MRRLMTKYLKPYIACVIGCIVLLFAQAMCDLNLPNMMSKIVNIGIQQNGIEDKIPVAISENGYDILQIIMTKEDKAKFTNCYQFIKKGSYGAKEYEKKYPLLQKENIYILKSIDANQIDAGSEAYGRSIMSYMRFAKEVAERKGLKLSGTSEDMSQLDLKQLYAMKPFLLHMKPEDFMHAQQTAREQDPSQLNQMSVIVTKMLYTELGINITQLQLHYMLKIGGMMLLLTLLGAFAAIALGFLAARVAAGLARNVRRDVFSKVEHFSSSEFDTFSTASLITRTTNDVTQVQMLTMIGLRLLCYAPIMGIGGIFMALKKSVTLSWIIAVAVIVLIGIIMVIYSVVMPKFKIAQKLVDKLNLVTRDNLSGMMVIRAFGTERFEEKRFDKANTDLTQNQLFVNKVMTIMMPAMMFMMNIITLVIVWVGAHQIQASALQVGDMMAFMQYAMQIIMSFLMISMIFIMAPRAAVSGSRIMQVLDSDISIKDNDNPKNFPQTVKGEILFDHVSFRYPHAQSDVISDVSFSAKPGQTTAFIGSTGSGKSTLVNLIPRFYDVTQGKILIDGVDVRDVPQKELREHIGYIPQKGVLFSGDIASNLRYGKEEASENDLLEAVTISQASEFIEHSKEGLNREIAQGGGNVSGGQKQRLSIARALIKKAPVYIFDDSFSALDFQTDRALRHALKSYIKEATVLIVAQRISTIMNAEQIIVLDNGKIVGRGTHKELLKSCATYREIAQSQLSEEELK